MARFGPQRRGEGALMRFGSVCSGIDAASVAWGPLGWRAAFFCEIEPAPARVLMARHGATRPLHPANPAHAPDARTGEEWARWAKAIARMPEGGAIPNHGDMQRFSEWPDHDIELLVGGTPCQSFSVAGLRRGLDDPRGSLMLTFGSVARRYRPRWLVWENVPGVLSQDGGRAFGTFLGMLGELGYGFAYRVLDARFFGVPQRGRRVFVVGCLGDWRAAAAVFLEPESLRGHSAPRETAREDLAGTLSARTRGGGGLGTDFECGGGLIAHTLRASGFDAGEDGTGRGVPLVAFGGNNTAGPIDVATALSAHGGPHGRLDFETETFVAFATQVRRLTEREYERLQGFPDDFTAVRGLSAGARYKALGNSMAVPVMRWIGERIVLVEQVLASLADRPPALEVAHPPKAKPRQEQQTSLLEAAKGSQREGAEELGRAA